MNEPKRSCYTREEIIEEARAFMVDTYGPVAESKEQDRWHERFGLLVSFLHDRFPSQEPRKVQS